MGVVRKADSLISLLRKGADYGRLAEENSDDPASAMKKGSLGSWYSRSSGFDNNNSKLLPNFEDALFALKDGEISDKVVTEYGIHIVRRDSTRGINLEAEKDEIKKLYRRVYYDSDKKEYLDNVKEKLGFTIYWDVMSELVSKLDTGKTTMQAEWNKNIDEPVKAKTLFKIGKSVFTVGDFAGKLTIQRDLKGTSTNTAGLSAAINKLADPIAFDFATENLEKEYVEFANLIKEFRDGILLFKVAAIEVWDKLKFDSSAAYSFWQPKKASYQTIPVYDLTEVFVLSDTIAKDIKKFALEGTAISSLAEQYTQRKGYREKKGDWGKVTIKDNKLAQVIHEYKPAKGDIVGPVTFENGFSVVKVNDYVPAREKTFEEAIPDFAPAYQEQMQHQLEDKWMASLRNKFKIVIIDKELDKVINSLKAGKK
jgi:peptidyl-prolyl cis-trans isomerase SurA